jgi:enamine deaminase RidA (YjgF/YER057c/UK114 family)
MSQALRYAGVVYTAGQVDDSWPSATEQTRVVLAKIDALSAEAGTEKSKCLSANNLAC